MSPRQYRMSRRADSAEATHRRIVDACFALHLQKGVAGTTLRDIAVRADVGIGTLYHHFATYEDVVGACGVHAMSLMKPPQPDIFDGVDRPDERIRTLVRELFDSYRRMPSFGPIRSERRQFAVLERAFTHEERTRRALIAAALRGARAGARLRALAFSLLDFDVYESLRACGVDHDAAVEEISSVLLRRRRSRK